MKNTLRLFLCLVAVMAIAAPAFAKNITSDDVTKFVKVTPDVEAFAKDMKQQGKDMEEIAGKSDKEEAFSPYTKSVKALKVQFPDDYKRLGGIVEKSGFKSQEEWADTSDSVMHAYIALRIEKDNPDLLKNPPQITEEQKKSLPPQALEQFERQKVMLAAVSKVPQGNKDAVKSHMAEIDAWLERSAAEQKAAAEANAAKAPAAAPAEKPAEKKAP